MNREIISKELLSLVLDRKIFKIHEPQDGEYDDENHIFFSSILFGGDTINLDTLGRLIREYIAKEGYIYNLFNSTSVQGYVMIINDNKVIGKTELEVCVKSIEFIVKENIKATEWVVENV